MTSKGRSAGNASSWTLIAIGVLLLCSTCVVAEEESCSNDETCRNKTLALHLKAAAIASILTASAIGVCLPILGRRWAPLRPENSFFFIIKAFAAGVILATGFVHVLPDAFESLTNPCLPSSWQSFPFAGFTAMSTAIATLLVDTLATSYYQRVHFRKSANTKTHSHAHGDDSAHGAGEDGEKEDVEHESHVHAHSHATHGHAHGSNTALDDSASAASKIRHRIISQVLELGIIAHSVIIGISLGASQSPCTIRPLVAALTFHQFFEGMGLGGCIVQAGFKKKSTALMAILFSLTTPLGIAVGIGISSSYNENSPKALAIEGMFDAASSGILIYMSLVDLLAADFLNSKMQKNAMLQAGSYLSLMFGAGAMSLLAIWA